MGKSTDKRYTIQTYNWAIVWWSKNLVLSLVCLHFLLETFPWMPLVKSKHMQNIQILLEKIKKNKNKVWNNHKFSCKYLSPSILLVTLQILSNKHGVIALINDCLIKCDNSGFHHTVISQIIDAYTDILLPTK